MQTTQDLCQIVLSKFHKAGARLVAIITLMSLTPIHAFEDEFKPLFNSTCIACHSNKLLSQLNLLEVDYDLSKPETYRTWVRVFDRLERGEMPPVPMPTPDSSILDPAMDAMKNALVNANLEKRGTQRAVLRRLTRLEYQYTIEDLLYLDAGIASELVSVLPAEADSGGFDTVANNQGISALHVRGYMTAAQSALDAALQTGPQPEESNFKIDYAKSQYLRFMSDAEFLGGGITTVVPGGVASYFDTASTYLFHSASEGFHVESPGQYDVTVEAFAHQANSPVTLTIYKGNEGSAGTAALTDLIGTLDLTTPNVAEFAIRTFMRPGHVISPSLADNQLDPDAFKYFTPELNVKDYDGEGIAFRSLSINGPIHEIWPPLSTRNVLIGVDFAENRVVLTKEPAEHIEEIVESFGFRAFRRPLTSNEVEQYTTLAEEALAKGRNFVDAVRLPLNAILTSPSFLFMRTEGDQLDAYGVASRLSYLLWRSMPDDELLALAKDGSLLEQDQLAAQITRMLADEKNERFVKDFVGQAYRIYEMHATSPDAGLYPEWDDRLSQAMLAESEMFFAELIKENMSISNLVDADFTFANRRLAEHYQLEGIDGQDMRKVDLQEGHERGGLLSLAAIHKITANGTTTSPVPRGNFVLTNLLGQPAPPPPPNVAGLEPDTRGTTTIREQLDAHRTNPVCASCHLSIDPPGFAMESFDPIGGFREHYRASGEKVVVDGETYPGQYTQGLAVDASGTTPEGDAFTGYAEYIDLLKDKKLKYIARQYASQLIVLSTGAEVQFADRDELNEIVQSIEADDYPMSDMILAVAQSELFRRP